MSIEEKISPFGTSVSFQKWQNYPLNMSGYGAVEVDLGSYHDRLSLDISRLVGDCTEVQTLTVEHPAKLHARVKTSICTIQSAKDLENYLMIGTESTSSFFSIRPMFSFGALQISEEALKILLTHFKVHPGFLDILHTFGEKIQEENEDFAIYKQHMTKEVWGVCRKVTSFELCYNLKHVERRQDMSDPDKLIWTTRKMGIYSKYYPASDSTTWILLQPSTYLSRRLEEVSVEDRDQLDGDKRRHDFDIHMLALQSANQSWTPFINHLEQEFKRLDDKAFVELGDAPKIQKLKDTLLQLAHSLDINSDAMTSLRRGLQIFQTEARELPRTEKEFHKYGTEKDFHKCDISLELLLFQVGQHKNRVQYLIRRTDGLFTLIPYILAQRENSIMIKLSEKGTQYARSMKVITIFTMIYLPPSFVASFFGIQLLNWDPNGDLRLAPQVGYYFVATLILMALTFGIWIWWERRSSRKPRERAHDEEKL